MKVTGKYFSEIFHLIDSQWEKISNFAPKFLSSKFLSSKSMVDKKLFLLYFLWKS